MLIGLVSDTHIAYPEEKIYPQIKEAFVGVDLILHAGDIWIPSVLDELESVAPVMAAWGDDDLLTDLGKDKRMMKDYFLVAGGLKIWLTHVKPRYALINPKEPPNISPHNHESFVEKPDVIVYGHSHFANIETYNDVLVVNPGSATVPNYVPKLGTVGFLEIDAGEAEARIVQLV